ncbi:MAG: type II toxin-antitoxin system HicB family antitoxin [Chloroflexi bacterium]|nr:type II toxin-antitoxin system HicB family antitoxin [Chloroflexota bacterium]
MGYAVLISKGPTSYSAWTPDLQGCFAVAKTREEVYKLICEGIEIYIDELQKRGDPVPEPESYELVMSVPSASLPKRGKRLAAASTS